MGRILTPALYAATMDAFRGDFFRQYKAAPEEAVMAIASALPATGGTVKNRGLGATPEMAEWVGPKVRQHLLDHSFDVEIVDYQATIEVHQNDIEDDQLGQYAEKIADLAVRAKGYLAPIVEQLVANNTALGYDGKALFANDHSEHESGAQDNLLAGTGTTLALVQADVATVYATMAGWKDDRGQIVRGYRPDTVMCGPSGTLIAHFTTIIQGGQAEGQPNLSGWIKRLLVNPYMTDLTDWLAFDTRPGTKAVVAYSRKEPTPVTIPMNSGSDFEEGKIPFSVEARGAAALGDWRRAVKVVNA